MMVGSQVAAAEAMLKERIAAAEQAHGLAAPAQQELQGWDEQHPVAVPEPPMNAKERKR
jgi:hypothetical protein